MAGVKHKLYPFSTDTARSYGTSRIVFLILKRDGASISYLRCSMHAGKDVMSRYKTDLTVWAVIS